MKLLSTLTSWLLLFLLILVLPGDVAAQRRENPRNLPTPTITQSPLPTLDPEEEEDRDDEAPQVTPSPTISIVPTQGVTPTVIPPQPQKVKEEKDDKEDEDEEEIREERKNVREVLASKATPTPSPTTAPTSTPTPTPKNDIFAFMRNDRPKAPPMKSFSLPSRITAPFNAILRPNSPNYYLSEGVNKRQSLFLLSGGLLFLLFGFILIWPDSFLRIYARIKQQLFPRTRTVRLPFSNS